VRALKNLAAFDGARKIEATSAGGKFERPDGTEPNRQLSV
jgi:hypothetical protein